MIQGKTDTDKWKIVLMRLENATMRARLEEITALLDGVTASNITDEILDEVRNLGLHKIGDTNETA